MCGIVGYTGPNQCVQILLSGLGKLEYRGYDSAGVAVLDGGRIAIRKSEGKLARLLDLVAREPIAGTCGVGHTRWATHGRPSDMNAHPHQAGAVAVVHNGIVENYRTLKERLQARGCRFTSETDTEVIPHLLDGLVASGLSLEEAVRRTIALIDEWMPVLVLCSKGESYEKTLSNLEEARARGGRVIAIGTEGALAQAEKAEEVFYLPECGMFARPIVEVVPLQLLAYHMAVLKGTDVDQPRNLAKSVTVE